MWGIDDIAFEIVNDMTDDPIVTVLVSTPAGQLCFVAELVEDGTTLCLKGAHVQGASGGRIGTANLLVIAQAVLQRMDYDELVVEGALRTTGARPGHGPRPMRIPRRILPPCSV